VLGKVGDIGPKVNDSIMDNKNIHCELVLVLVLVTWC
jgi:hypothetical protein